MRGMHAAIMIVEPSTQVQTTSSDVFPAHSVSRHIFDALGSKVFRETQGS